MAAFVPARITGGRPMPIDGQERSAVEHSGAGHPQLGRGPNLQYGLQSTVKKVYGFLIFRSFLKDVFDEFDYSLISTQF